MIFYYVARSIYPIPIRTAIMNIEKLREQQKKLAASFKDVTVKIKKAEIEDRKHRYENAGRELEQIYLSDPLCTDSQKIADICSKYFVQSKNLIV